jgi:hypothetical protein
MPVVISHSRLDQASSLTTNGITFADLKTPFKWCRGLVQSLKHLTSRLYHYLCPHMNNGILVVVGPLSALGFENLSD